MVTLAIFILRQMLSVGQLKISLPGQPDIVVLPRKRSQKGTAELVPEDRLNDIPARPCCLTRPCSTP
jgi:hypothetical protein